MSCTRTYLIPRDREAAEDTVRGAFARLCERMRSSDEARPFGPWFLRLVVNDAVKAASKRERTVSFYRGDAEELISRMADPARGPQEAAEDSETRRRVWRALEQLPPAQRAVIVQRYYLGMTEAEMAGSAASPPGTVKSRLNTARKSLSKLLRPQLHAERPASLAVPLDRRGGGEDHD